jgi:hypothetical protein
VLSGTTVLDAQAIHLLHKQHIPTDREGSVFYGYGWSIEPDECGTLLISHNGSNGIFYCDFLRFVEKDIIIFIATNSARRKDRHVGVNIIDAIFKNIY